MPLYEYYCTDCEITREALLPVPKTKTDTRKVPCPICKKPMKKYVGKVHLSSKRATYGY